MHWAFIPPRDQPVPAVNDTAWPRTPVDRFILARLEAVGLRPAPAADRHTLLRRASLDLTGLPPTVEEMERFQGDRSADAFERVVDRLLASPHHGERWGRHWLDVARYADTKGYVFYYEESQFVQPQRYRDWVIRALNEDLPYDRFLQLQVAADQWLPAPATSDPRASTIDPVRASGHPDLAALGFLSLGRRFLGNPHDIIDDQLDVLIRGTQGLTIGCARCHDHKFDPVTMADYYALHGILQSSQERVVPLADSPGPETLMPFAEARARVEFERELKARVQKLEDAFKAAAAQVADRLRDRTADYLVAVTDRDRLPTVSANVRPAPDDLNPYNVRQWDNHISQIEHGTGRSDPVFGPWFAFAAIPADDFAGRAPAVALELVTEAGPDAPTSTINPLVARLFTQAPASMAEVARRYGRLFVEVHQQWRAALGSAKTNRTAVPTLLSEAAAEQVRQVLYGARSPVLPPSGPIVELDVQLYFDDPNRVALSRLQMEIEQWLDHAPGAPPYALVLEDRPVATNAHILRRGDAARPGPEVPRRFLEVLGGSDVHPFDRGSGRLELARSLTDPGNPLTARVIVNRVWAHHFGVGLVATPSDFGTRSEPPSHPELLDWLARRFMADGWSLKKLHRLIVLSAVYQQASASPAVAGMPPSSTDPANRLLHQFPRRRLDFETLRDGILAASGELDLQAGGRAFDLDARPAISRRTVYGRIDRKSLPGVMRTFDFANPDLHAPQRHATIVPQQALYLLNSDWLVERARALAGRAKGNASGDPSECITRLYERVHQRPPTPGERELGLEFLRAAGTDEKPLLTPLEQFAQVLLLSNESAHLN